MLLTVLQPGSGIVESSEISTEAAAAVLDAFWASREAIWSGIVELDVQKIHGHERKTMSARYSLMYDRSLRCIRWSLGEKGNEWIYIETPDTIAIHVPGSGVLSKYAIDHKPNIAELRPKDPQLLGVTSISEWEINSLADTRRFLEDKATVRVESVERGMYQLRWSYPILGRTEVNGTLKPVMNCQRLMTVDSTDSLCVPRWSETFHRLDGTPVPEFHSEAEISYDRVNGVSVPVHAHYLSTEAGVDELLDVRLRWKMVNEGIDEQLFEANRQDVPGGTLIVDNRIAKGVVESVVPRDGRGDLPGGSLPVIMSKQSFSVYYWALIVVNLIVVAVLTFLLMCKWRRHPRMSGRC
jgi:hypothetical protein